MLMRRLCCASTLECLSGVYSPFFGCYIGGRLFMIQPFSTERLSARKDSPKAKRIWEHFKFIQICSSAVKCSNFGNFRIFITTRVFVFAFARLVMRFLVAISPFGHYYAKCYVEDDDAPREIDRFTASNFRFAHGHFLRRGFFRSAPSKYVFNRSKTDLICTNAILAHPCFL